MTLGVDTTVALDGRSYGKPEDLGAATTMLRDLSGRTHMVVSGLCLLGPELDARRARGHRRHVQASHRAAR